MSVAILLDASLIGLISNPRQSKEARDCQRWATRMTRRSVPILIPEIADYEIRRELIRGNKGVGLAHLDGLAEQFEYLPLTTQAMRWAAQLWAEARQKGIPTASPSQLDGDAILGGQAASLRPIHAVVATANVRHLRRYVEAKDWTEISFGTLDEDI